MPSVSKKESASAHNKKILIIEDEKPVSKALELKLGNNGFTIHAVYDGAEALKALEKERYDLIVLDLVIPLVDGFSILEWLKSKMIKTPVIITSNLSQDVDKKRTQDLGAVDYFVKSDIPISEVVERVRKALNL